jgi:glycosyltransferase involved in cell wall biosynthesis
MRIAQIIYTGFGGLGSVAFSLISADRTRFREWQVAFIGEQPIDPSYPPLCEKYGVAWQAFRSTPGRPYRAWLALTRWLARKQPDAILLHSINSVLPSRLVAWWRRIPLVAVEHTPNAVKTRSEWAASRLTMLLADRVVLLTPEYREELAKAHGRLFWPAKVAIVPNGIDTDRFYPGAGQFAGTTTIRLGMAARFSFSKRQDLLVAALHRLVDRRPDIEWRLALAGDGDRLAAVQRLAADHRLAGAVRFAGLLPESAVADWLRELDIYVHASEGETLSTSLLQAMATGLPIVASDVPGIRNLLTGKGETVGILSPNDPDAFADAVIRLIDDPSRRRALGKWAREVCVARYGNRVMLDGYLRLISEVSADVPA